VEVRPKSYRFHSAVRWSGERKGIASSVGKPDVEVATPPEFKGHVGIWSPEDLFVASANVCLMTTFLSFAERAGLSFTGYESEAVGLLELIEGKFAFTLIVLRPRITLKSGEDTGKAKLLIEKAEANCLISNSMKPRVTLEPTIV